MASYRSLPKLVVFDLDYTLWPFWIDTHVTPPFRKTKNSVVDMTGATVKFYPDVPQILKKISDMNIPIAIASRTTELEAATQLCELFDWNKYFKYTEIYPGTKVEHFKQFKKQSGIDFNEMIFFDDEERNIRDLTKLNVTCVLVRHGMTAQLLEEGLKMFENKK